ncbi:MAG: lipase/acyltransferase domain-containing protein, partial [Pyrinomonadaceae bacterium]
MPSALRHVILTKSFHRARRYLCLRAYLLIAVCVINLFAQGCGARRTPDLKRVFAEARTRTGKRPLIVIPGILGSQLVNQKTGEIVWPSAFRSAADGLSLPVSPRLAENRDNLVAEKIVDTAKLFNTVRFARLVPEVYVYRELLQALNDYGGYREGDWENPGANGDQDTFYVFAYDWRRDNVENARLLVTRIEELKRKLDRPDLRFNIVAHSMGGLLARYAAMYGDADLPEGEASAQPTWAGAGLINNIFMFGTPNNGSMEAFATLLGGYSITDGLRRRLPLLNKLSREDAVTIPALFQLLPHNGAERFLDENLKSIKIDLYDPSVWQRYKWSAANDADFRRRFRDGNTRADDPPQRGSLDALDAYFDEVIKRAKGFHEAINRTESGEFPVKIFVFGGDCE